MANEIVIQPKTSLKAVKKTCNICCSDKSSFITCLYCSYDSCHECTQTYILDNIVPKCMSCSKQWSYEFIQNNFTSTFVNGKYKKHRENILLNKEKSLLPETQIVLAKKNKEKKIQEQLKALKEQEELLKRKLMKLNRVSVEVYGKRENKVYNCIKPDCRGFLAENNTDTMTCGVCTINVCKSCRERRDDEHKCDPNIVENLKAIEKECKPCPKCNSMIYFVSGCFDGETLIPLYNGSFKNAKEIEKGDVLIGDDGNPREVLDTVNGEDDMYEINQNNGISYTVNSKHTLLLKDTNDNVIEILVDEYYNNYKSFHNLYGYKSNTSPNKDYLLSTVSIKKLDKNKYYGWKLDKNNRFILSDFTVTKNCSQMWCTQCQTAFDWRTGKIETGIIHNPHYWEYVRKLGQEDREVNRMFGNGNNQEENVDMCNFRFEDLLRNRNFTKNINYVSADILEMFRLVNHTSRYEKSKYESNLEDPKTNEDIRMRYLSKEIDEMYLKSMIQRRYKMSEFKHEAYMILDTFETVMRTLTVKYYNIIRQLSENNNQEINKQISEWMKENMELNKFTIDSIEKLCKRFSYKVPQNLEFNFQHFSFIFERISDLGGSEKFEPGMRNYIHSIINTYSSKYRSMPYNRAKSEIIKMWGQLSEEQKRYYIKMERVNTRVMLA